MVCGLWFAVCGVWWAVCGFVFCVSDCVMLVAYRGLFLHVVYCVLYVFDYVYWLLLMDVCEFDNCLLRIDY